MDDLDRAVLDIESQHWRYAGAKEAAIRERTGLNGTAYYRRLVQLLDDPPADVAVEFGPLLVRLRRVRDQRLQQRAGRRAS